MLATAIQSNIHRKNIRQIKNKDLRPPQFGYFITICTIYLIPDQELFKI